MGRKVWREEREGEGEADKGAEQTVRPAVEETKLQCDTGSGRR